MEDSRLYDIANKLSLKVENLIVEALAKKGYSFETNYELSEFVKQNVSCFINEGKNERIYSVKGIPFFLHKYKTEISPVIQEGNSFKIDASLGSYSFL